MSGIITLKAERTQCVAFLYRAGLSLNAVFVSIYWPVWQAGNKQMHLPITFFFSQQQKVVFRIMVKGAVIITYCVKD